MRMTLTLISLLLCAACSDASSDSDGSGDGFQVVGFDQDSATGDVPSDTVAGDAVLDAMTSDAAVLDAPVLVVDNGAARYCCVRTASGWDFVDAVPRFGAG